MMRTAPLALAAVLAMGAAMFAFSGSSSAAVSALKGDAYGYLLSVSLFGGPAEVRGPAPTVSLAPDGSNSPQRATQPSATAIVGPATFFTSGQLDVSTQGSTGPDGVVTATARVADITSAAGEVFTASNVLSSCTSLVTNPTTSAPPPGPRVGDISGTTTISGGMLQTDTGDDQNGDGDFTDPGEHGPTTVDVPSKPFANTVIPGHTHVNGVQENFEYVFNEQVENPDGSLIVYVAHQRLLGPTAVGDLYIGKVECGTTGIPEPSTTGPPSGKVCLGEPVTIVGTDGDDLLEGTSGRDVIMGLGGNDIIRGLAGDDVICGGPGDDRIAAGTGNDRVSGGAGNDRITGGGGNDILRGGEGDDRIIGGAGDDVLDGSEGTDDCRPGDGNNTVHDCELNGRPPAQV